MEKHVSRFNKQTAIALLVAGTFFMENLDATVITPAVPQMAHSFAVSPVALNSGVSAYMLALGVFIPASGWVADRFGARRIFGLAIALFTVTSLLCGLAQSLPEFVMLRILQGIGGAMMVPVGRLVVLRATPKEKLIDAIAILTWPALVAPVLGPPLGGWIADYANWRWIFYLNLPLGVVAFILAWLVVPDTRHERGAGFDWLGFALCSAGLFCLLYVAELVGAPRLAWYLVLLLTAAGIVLLVMATLHLRRVTHPMLDLSALKLKSFAVTIWGGSLFRMGVSAVPFLLPVMFQIGFGYSAFAAGSMLMAVFAGNLAMKTITTPILRRFGFRPVLIVNGLLNALAIAACAVIGGGMPVPAICAILFVSGATRSMQFTAFNTLAFADVPQAEMTAANTLFSTLFQLAMGLGIALGAISWRLGEVMAPPDASAALPFRIAFLLVALVSLLGVADSLTLSREAGANVSRGKPAKV
ncbi:major facilitator superfamily multidrug resistance transporter [Acidocella aminolytica 101 = DSM 11237]|uniref:Major facilitator superfamily multidrug resistance transporter n=1 Tax=Acidocella aminolytica 101 = DSM 11237 TaxID=1120923 RepID=A0A0D6PD28_9PROT|nr:major facilitator superfamily multidrug resistance transporter [Acidocella aminolytica 101 = DSM 11237]GBQ39070.1 major facilitator superfamily transporter [Acidocella aminolytica 101 = DSM 11237]